MTQAKQSKEPIIQHPIQEYLQELYKKFRKIHDGEVATYIPELGKANPDWFGICLVTADGKIYEAGETEQTFTIQSISKPFNYGIALEDNGKADVLKKIWVEPTGEAFNSISLQPSTGRPLNPMINAGAIATTSLVEGKTTKQKIHRILDALGRYAGRKLEVDMSVYRSESETGHRNRAIAYMLRNFDIITEDPMPSLEAYFMQCSILVNCRDLGIMAATLANGGVNPVTGKRAVVGDYVENILSVMGSCGMYDAAGEWVYNVGMPAKSGVAGGILAVLPGQLGVGIFSPRLDSHGNSVRGIEVCRELSQKFSLHMFHVPHSGRSVIRRMTHGNIASSNRLRTVDEMQVLKKEGHRIALLELQGELHFATAEVVVRESIQAAKSDYLLLNFAHIQTSDLAGTELLSELARHLVEQGKFLIFTHTQHLPILARVVKRNIPAKAGPKLQWIEDSDLALEWCENQVIETHGERHPSSHAVSLPEFELLQNLTREDVGRFEKLLKPRRFSAGETILHTGDPAHELYFLQRGKASVWIHLPNGVEKRMATFSPGMAFGEMALLDKTPRSAQVLADTNVECLTLAVEEFEALASSHPVILITLLRNLSQVLARRLRRANMEISVLYQ